jgi:hypothetical protein
MTPSDWYRERAVTWTAERDRQARAAVALSRMRLATFGGAVLSGGWAWHAWTAVYALALVALALACLVGFIVFVRQHARVLERQDRAEAGLRLSTLGLARIAREWSVLPDVPAPPHVNLETHPYARDLDLFGHASLTTWLGPAATMDGARTLIEWLLAPSAAIAVAERQEAVKELAPAREWRESLAVEGRLTRLSSAELAGFLEWTGEGHSAVPRFLKVASVLLPALLLVLLALFAAGVTDGAWWLVPLSANVVLSFVYDPAAFRAFDRVSFGERGLRRYGAMLDLVCAAQWRAPFLRRVHTDACAGGPAPAALHRLALLTGWSELRSGAAILHFPVQALTMWDFHVLFAIERWRRRSGVHVRQWLDALGTADALSVLATAAADEPEWTIPVVDEAADTIEATAIGHPLIAPQRRVANDLRVGPPGSLLLVTGSNMSGKSTLLRALGLNVVLAQAGAPVCAASLRLPQLELQTSIRVQDSLELGLSYFMAALARLKQIVDASERRARPGWRLFYLLDEVLQGTNSVERGVAVRAVANHLLDAGAIGAMTTHDLALAHEDPFVSKAVLVHFTEQLHADGAMTFDYRLRPGLATSTNALRLMQAIGITPR